ncbi:MAG: HAMP domain-containing histidine kinase [Spirochaetales bacterium]|nr:HAMP domain-containing histidine kinase [Spirochaetales bacterium]
MRDRRHRASSAVGRDSPVFFGILLALFVAVTALSVFLLSGERRRNLLLAEYQTERVAGVLLEAVRDGENPEELLPENSLVGFAVYSGDGAALMRTGSAPSTLDAPPGTLGEGMLPAPHFRHDRERRTLTLIRILGMPAPHMGTPAPHMGTPAPHMGTPAPHMGTPAPHMEMRPRRGMADRARPGAPRLLFLELSAEAFYARQRALVLAQIFLPLATLGAMVLVAVLYRNNQSIRRELASREQLARLGEASRTLTHEIKNPLSAIRIQTGVLKKTLPQERQEELHVIEEETRRLALLTDRIGDFLRDPVGRVESIDLDRFVRALVLRYDRRIQYAPSGERDLRTMFDPQRLRSVVENLVNNALEAGSDETVEIAVEAKGPDVIVKVLDRGPGIPEAIRSKVFDPFFTSKVQGSGVGLAIARRFVEAAGGRLVLEGRRDGGTEARVVLRRQAR